MNEDTTIRIKKTTSEALKKLGTSGDSYNDVIVMLLQTYEKSIMSENYK